MVGLSPILLRFAFHRRRGRVLNLKPMVDAAGAIRIAEPFRHDPFAAKSAGVLVDGRAVALICSFNVMPRADALRASMRLVP